MRVSSTCSRHLSFDRDTSARGDDEIKEAKAINSRSRLHKQAQRALDDYGNERLSMVIRIFCGRLCKSPGPGDKFRFLRNVVNGREEGKRGRRSFSRGLLFTRLAAKRDTSEFASSPADDSRMSFAA